MAQEIKNATPEQWAQIEGIVQKVIADQTVQADYDDVVNAVTPVWKQLGHTPIKVLLAASPIEGALVFASILVNTTSELRDRISSSKLTAVKTVDKDLCAKYVDMAYAQIGPEIARDIQFDHALAIKALGLMPNVLMALHDDLSITLTQAQKEASAQLVDAVRAHLYVSIFWSAYYCWYLGAKVLGVTYDEEKFKVFEQWTKSVPTIYAHNHFPVVSRKMAEVHWQGNVLHNAKGPAVGFPDNWGLYVFEGVTVDKQIIMAPETQTLQQINGEDNADRKMIRIQRYGWDRYITDCNMKPIHSRKNTVEGTLEVLYDYPDRQSRVLVASCPTGRIPAMLCPPDVKTCEEAQAWLHGGDKLHGFPLKIIGRT